MPAFCRSSMYSTSCIIAYLGGVRLVPAFCRSSMYSTSCTIAYLGGVRVGARLLQVINVLHVVHQDDINVVHAQTLHGLCHAARDALPAEVRRLPGAIFAHLGKACRTLTPEWRNRTAASSLHAPPESSKHHCAPLLVQISQNVAGTHMK